MNRALMLALAIGVAGATPVFAQSRVDSCVGVNDGAARQSCEEGRGQDLNAQVDHRYNQSAQYNRTDRRNDISRSYGTGDGGAGIGTSPSARSSRSYNDGGSGN